MNEQFARDVMQGLSASPKFLSSKYFYDHRGDALFQQIMALPEYYLTSSEHQVFETHKEELLASFQGPDQSFDLIEFGAGDGLKTKVLLAHFLQQGADFSYMPIDISKNVLDQLQQDLSETLPGLQVETLPGEYFQVLSKLTNNEERKKVVLFLGSNIGNFLKPVAVEFLSNLSSILTKGDHLLLGVDLIKDPYEVAAAYNDSQGVTKAFNLNLLSRINNELGGNFEVDSFMHYPVYNPVNGEARSILVSTLEQTVRVEKLNASFHFGAWETISMELSQKYDLDSLVQLAKRTGFKIVNHYFDSKKYFTDSLWEVL